MGRIARRQMIAGSAATVLASCIGRLHAATTDWTPIDPAEAGFAPGLVGKLDQFVLTGQAINVHSVLVVRRGRMVAERYYEGEDQVRISGGRTQVEHVGFSAERSHELRSVTKSVVGLLYGIALSEGKVPSLDQPLLAQFPQYTDLPDMAQRRRWTIAQAITMTLGIDWNEQISYDDPRNGQTAMEAAPDRYRYALEQPIVAEPGKRWIYSGGATALIGKILENGIRRSVHDFAREVLFDPLGIGPTEWRNGRDREMNFASGLAMRPRDLARIGQMLLDGGKIGERQIVPSSWLDAAFTPAIEIRDRREYGYHWYLGEIVFNGLDRPRRERWIAAMGNGGQRLYVFPRLELLVAVTAGNYNRRDQGTPPNRVLTEVVLPNIR
jgi:CubicO group peptidase (beta-lactamase class C family)